MLQLFTKSLLTGGVRSQLSPFQCNGSHVVVLEIWKNNPTKLTLCTALCLYYVIYLELVFDAQKLIKFHGAMLTFSDFFIIKYSPELQKWLLLLRPFTWLVFKFAKTIMSCLWKLKFLTNFCFSRAISNNHTELFEVS